MGVNSTNQLTNTLVMRLVTELQGSVSMLQSEVIQLSERYIRALARDSQGVVDGPYVGRFTAYGEQDLLVVDMKYCRQK